MMRNQHSTTRFTKGFTLIELMVVIAVVGIVTAIALPSYTDYIRKSRRADGISALISLHLAQEKFRGNCVEYARGRADAEVCNKATPANNRVKHLSTSIDGHYILEFKDKIGADVTPTATGYTIRATPQAGDDQTNDRCKSFVLTVTGGAIDEDVSNDATETKERCWAH